MSNNESPTVTETARANERFPADSRVARRLTMLAAAAAAVPAVAGTEAEALEYYNSGDIAANNTVGWLEGVPQLTDFSIALKQGNAYFSREQSGISNIYNRVRFKTNALNKNFLAAANFFGFGTYLLPLAAGKAWGTAANTKPANNRSLGYLRTNGFEHATYGHANLTNQYVLFKFKDTGQDYYGWVKVDSAINYTNNVPTVTVTIKSYAWQTAAEGILTAGAVAVPEPSTVVTGGIAALTGGAMALRRWRRARKQAEAMA